MECIVRTNSSTIWAIAAPCGTVALLAMVLLCLYLVYRKRLINEWQTMRINGLKRRWALADMHACASEHCLQQLL